MADQIVEECGRALLACRVRTRIGPCSASPASPIGAAEETGVSRQRIIGFCGSSWRPARSRALVEAVGATCASDTPSPPRSWTWSMPARSRAFSRDGLSDSARGVIEAIEAPTVSSSAARCSRAPIPDCSSTCST